MELWKDVIGYPNYEVSNTGFIRNKKNPEKVNKANKNYKYKNVVKIYKPPKEGEKYSTEFDMVRLDALIYRAFRDPNMKIYPISQQKEQEKDYFIKHIDDDLTNNKLDNLKLFRNKAQPKKVVVYYENEHFNKMVCKFSDCDEIKLFKEEEIKDYHRYNVLKPYEATKESLIKFYDVVISSISELKNNDIFKFDYLQYYTHHTAINGFLNELCDFSQMEQITMCEYEYQEACNNAGLMYFDKSKKGVYKCYGRDLKNAYPTIMASEDFEIPTKQGKLYKLEKLPKRTELEYGYYRVKITCTHPEFLKIFSFSAQNTYTHYSLDWAMKNKKKYNVEFELLQDGDSNALLYDESCLVSGRVLFGEWFDTITALREKYPHNCLIKNISSSTWGRLTQKNKQKTTRAECKEKGIKVSCFKGRYLLYDEEFGCDRIIMIDKEHGYKYNVRIGSFLTSFCRVKVAKIAVKCGLEHVLRIQTDNITFTKDIDITELKIKKFEVEDKTTGLIEWHNVNEYYHICESCNEKYRYADKNKHQH